MAKKKYVALSYEMNWDQGWSINPSDLHLMSIYLIRIGKPVEQKEKHIRTYYVTLSQQKRVNMS